MNKLTLSLGIAVLALGTTSLSMAQAAGPAGGAPKAQGGHARNGVRMMKMEQEVLNQLGLSADQKSKAEANLKNLQNQLKALRAQAGQTANRQAMRGQFANLRKTYMTNLQAILTPAQLKQYHAIKKEMRQKFQQQHGKPAGGTIKP